MVVKETQNEKIGKRASLAATVGTVIEFYDFFLYATAAAIIFPHIFFPESSTYLGTLQSFGTLAIGFLARPFGAIIFGHLGDRIGRKSTLVYTILLMGISSFAIGLLPSYEIIGVWAPTLLIFLRFVQGVGVGGEWGGSILLSMEWGKKKNQALKGSWPQMGVAIGLLLASLVFSLVTYISGDGLYTWGWRIPFLLSALLLVIAYVIRIKIPETPKFETALSKSTISRYPIFEVLKKHPKEVILTAFIRMSENGPFYVYTVLMMNYALENFQFNKQSLLNINSFASIFMIFSIPLFGYLADRYGIKRIYLLGVFITFLWAIPYIILVDSGNYLIILSATLIAMIPHSMQVGPQGAFVANNFPTHLRYSGVSLGSQIGAILSGGIAPLICTILLHEIGSIYAISGYIILTAIITFSAALILKDSNEKGDIKFSDNEKLIKA
ncbi:MFS transporter [Psychrobacillus glaciei]|uniref:MFS transporter n=2 Tax=Psychrobacillus glaciei TaxID=2283160 RepID=A0A5J6ST29_9BACI|nr:MFS transporter [Psychrobacillus glaciei]